MTSSLHLKKLHSALCWTVQKVGKPNCRNISETLLYLWKLKKHFKHLIYADLSLLTTVAFTCLHYAMSWKQIQKLLNNFSLTLCIVLVFNTMHCGSVNSDIWVFILWNRVRLNVVCQTLEKLFTVLQMLFLAKLVVLRQRK